MANEKLQKWALVAEIASAIAVVVSLIFLALQIKEGNEQSRLNTEAVRASTLQEHLRQHSLYVLEQANNAELAAILVKGRAGLDALSEHDYARYGPFVTNQMRNHFAAHELMRTGLLPSGHWQTFAAALERSMHRSKGVRELWSQRRHEFPEEFRKLVDDIAARAESTSSGQPD